MAEPLRFRRGMTTLERQKYREAVLRVALEKARQKASEYRLTSVCREAMDVMSTHPEQAAGLHAQCEGEEPGNDGCLCVHHDVVTGSVTSGFSAEV